MDLAYEIEKEISERVNLVNAFVENYLKSLDLSSSTAISSLQESMLYSATNGGKRFRPVLSVLTGELLGASAERVLPFAVAVELIHTYSLIHDDLPCMDNDDIRRGKPTNHKVYGEDFALLAGDALLTEAFHLVAESYADNGFLGTQLVKLLAKAAGIRGMVGGQAIDLKAQTAVFNIEDLTLLHSLKTGALIQLSVEGAAMIAGAKPSDIESLKKFGAGLGLAFQIADDILDHGEKDQNQRSFTGYLGIAGTQSLLAQVSQEALQSLHKVSTEAPLLEHLINFNQKRKV